METIRLWPVQSSWELHDLTFSTFCPHCCLGDLARNRAPYGRQIWQQSWCTFCHPHGAALIIRNVSRCSHKPVILVESAAEKQATIPRRQSVSGSESIVTTRGPIDDSWVPTRDRARGGGGYFRIAPNSYSWGTLTPPEFLLVLQDSTTWALTHFEPVRCWSIAEEFTATEEQEGYGLIGRTHRMSASDYRDDCSTRTLRSIVNPKVRGAALWTAHALMATCHVAASDRPTGKSTQDRQTALLSRSAPASRQWLAQRQARWPPEYRRLRWIDVQKMA